MHCDSTAATAGQITKYLEPDQQRNPSKEKVLYMIMSYDYAHQI